MDVDLLRPGNVPISPNTVLWFEFLLNPNLLEEHLKKPNPDPVPSDLLIKFLTLSVEPSTEEVSEKTKNFKCTKRALSMKILALKIIAHWKWNLEMIETKLPLQLQYVLLRDLLCLSSDDQSDQNLFAPTMHLNLIVDQLRDEQVFAIALYHRWALRIIVNSSMVSKNILCCTTSNVESADEIMSKIMDDETKSEILLQRIVKLKKDFILCPTFYTFSPPTENEEMKHDWENGLKMSANKFFAQIHYELGMYKIYGEIHGEAVDYFTRCKTLHEQVKTEDDESTKGFFEINEISLKGFCYACGISTDEKRNLILQFYAAIRNNYHDIINILQTDNQQREIPLSYRDSLELDLASNLASGKFTASRDLLFQIQTLNLIRRLVEGAAYPSVLDYVTKLNKFRKGSAILTKALKRFVGEATSEEKLKIRSFLLMLFGQCDFSLVRSMIADNDFSSLFSETELNDIRKRLENDGNDLAQLKETDELDEKKMKLMGSSQLELSLLELQIIRTYNPIKLKEFIDKFVSTSNGRLVIDIYNRWKKFFRMRRIEGK